MKKALWWGIVLLGSVHASDAGAVPRPKPGDAAATGHSTGAITSMPIWVTVVVVIAVAILLRYFISRRKR